MCYTSSCVNYSWTKCFKNCKNISTDGEVMAKMKVACFFLGHGVYRLHWRKVSQQNCATTCLEWLKTMLAESSTATITWYCRLLGSTRRSQNLSFLKSLAMYSITRRMHGRLPVRKPPLSNISTQMLHFTVYQCNYADTYYSINIKRHM